MLETAIKRIEEQQAKLKEGTAAWVVGEQLKDICRREAKSAELIAQDLQVESMSITEAEKRIKAFSDKNVGKEKFFCVTPVEADRILREFYGLPSALAEEETPKAAEPAVDSGKLIDISDFL